MSNLVWQSQPLEAPRISLEYVRYQAERLNGEFRRENYSIRAAVILCAVIAVVLVILKPPVPPPTPFPLVLRVGPFLLLLGAIYAAFEVHRRGRFLSIGEDDGVVKSLEAYRIELLRRRNYYLRASRWPLWPCIAATVVTLVGGMLYDQRPHKLIRYSLASAVCVVGALLGSLHYRNKGRKYQRELDALATLDKS